MDFKTLTPQISVTRQITAQDVADATVQGYGAILSNRPDGEEPGQPSAADIAELADRHGMAFEACAGRVRSDHGCGCSEDAYRPQSTQVTNTRLLPHRNSVSHFVGVGTSRSH